MNRSTISPESALTSHNGGAGALGAPDGLPRTAATIAIVSWLLAGVSTVLLIVARPPVTDNLWYFLVDVTVAVVYGLVAGLTLSRRRHPVPWLVALMSVGCGLAAFGFACESLDARRPVPGMVVIEWLQTLGWVPGTLAIFLIVPWLIRDHRLGWPARAGVVAGILAATAFIVAQVSAALTPFLVSAGAVVLVGLVTAAEVTWRWRRGPVDERIGLGWLAVGVAVMALSFVPMIASVIYPLPIWVTPVLHLIAQAVFPAAILVSVLRQRMWGLDLAISRTVLGGLLTVGLVVLYTAVTAVLTRFLPGDGLAQVVAAAVVAVAVQPSRLRLQRHVRRLVYGDAAEPERAVRRLGRHLGGAQSAEELLNGLVESVGHALRLESVTLDVEGVRAAAWGTATSLPLVVPLEHRGDEVGLLSVTAPPGEALDTRALRALDELVSVVSAGVVLARASQDLADARQRLTSVRLEERRVIRRELHDGLGPSLAGIRLGLQGARNLIGRDPQAAGTLLAALQDELDGRVNDVRTLSRNLLPPILDELGLAPALAELAARHAQGSLDVRVRCEGAEGLSPQLATAVYGIVVEAVMNVARHAEASRCDVEVTIDAQSVRLVVEDDGTGFRADAVAGVGTRSMRERAEEQGGAFEIGPAANDGTRVAAVLPL
ncbi:sensor histidine kinase [Cryptosporangium aurantiacum]|uniref:Histidine kinase n=1 Tax=Cryptosporangium aurantiacum TaxID=134849 RepID=A0A1M7Q9C4_9ACTN|nr:histidine kinase [Cryptosporangium aurantiacum]SHN27150.1 Histidine kinase [Cryptosporangium aurantiacum]